MLDTKFITLLSFCSGKLIEIAEIAGINDLYWLQVDGKYEIQKLKEGLKYKVQFKIMLRDDLKFDVPVDLALVLPDGTKQENQENLMRKPRNQWIWLKVGEYKAQNVYGDIYFSLKATDVYTAKKGLVIGGVRFLPTT